MPTDDTVPNRPSTSLERPLDDEELESAIANALMKFHGLEEDQAKGIANTYINGDTKSRRVLIKDLEPDQAITIAEIEYRSREAILRNFRAREEQASLNLG